MSDGLVLKTEDSDGAIDGSLLGVDDKSSDGWMLG